MIYMETNQTNQTLTMETILIITKNEMFSDISRNYIKNKVRNLKKKKNFTV